MEELVAKLEQIALGGKTRETFVIPNNEQGALAQLYKNATVESVDYGAEGVTVVATVDAKMRGQLNRYRIGREDETSEEE